MVVAAIVLLGEFALAVDGAAEFAAPDHEGIVEHAALLQVGDQRRAGLVGIAAERRGQVVLVQPPWVSQPWWNSCTKRTPRSASRRARRQLKA